MAEKEAKPEKKLEYKGIPAVSGRQEKPKESETRPQGGAPEKPAGEGYEKNMPAEGRAGERGPTESAREGEIPSEPDTIEDFIKIARLRAKPRRFVQSWDLCINLKGLNLKKPENRFNTDFTLPEGRGKDVRIAFFADSLAPKAKSADLVIKKAEIETLAKDKKGLKRIVNGYDWFFGEATLMVQIGKSMGSVLAPRGKMPRPIPPNMDPDPLMLSAKKNVRIQVKESPVLHIPIGSDRMDDSQVAKNLEAVFNFVKDKLPKGRANIKSVFVKLTMGPAVRVRMK